MASDGTFPEKPRPAHWFKPGQSGNPGGMPKGLGDVKALARAYTAEAVEGLVRVLRDDKAPPAATVAAAEAILNRGWGRPTAGESGPDGEQILRIITGVAREKDPTEP